MNFKRQGKFLGFFLNCSSHLLSFAFGVGLTILLTSVFLISEDRFRIAYEIGYNHAEVGREPVFQDQQIKIFEE